MNLEKKDDRKIPPFLRSEENSQEVFYLPEILDVHNYIGFGVTKNGQRSSFLKLIKKNGEIDVLFYNRIISPINYDGGGKIKIHIPGATYNLIGTNVTPLVDYLANNQIVWIKEAITGDRMNLKKGEPLIISINY